MNTSKAPFTSYQWLVILILSLTQFSVVLDFMVMSPLGDLLIKNLKITPSQFGVVVSSYALSAGISGFLTAAIADKFDRKKLLLFFYGGFILGTFLCAIAESYSFLVFARIFTGIFGGVMASISMAIVSDIFTFEQRGRVMGFLQMGFGLSQILGIPISLYMAAKWGWQSPFYLIVVLAAVIFLAGLFILQPVNAHLQLQRDNPLKHMFKTIMNRNYRIGFLATAFMSLGGYLMMPWGSAYAVNNMGVDQKDLWQLFMYGGIVTFAIMPIIGSLSDRWDKFNLFVVASILMVITVLIYTNLPKVGFWPLMIVNIFMMMGIMARMVPSQALSTSMPEMADRGAYMSINSSLQQVAGGIAAIIGGLVVTQKTEESQLEHFTELGLIVTAVILINIFFTKRVYNFVTSKNENQQKKA